MINYKIFDGVLKSYYYIFNSIVDNDNTYNKIVGYENLLTYVQAVIKFEVEY